MSEKNIDIVTGNPKRAINKLALPIIASMFLIFANNIIDSVWVAGLGSQPLAALGYITPLFMILVGIGNGIGAGSNSLISRYIGAEKKNNADNTAIHAIILSILISIIVTIIILVFLRDVLLIMGAESVVKYGMEYGIIMFAWSFAVLMPPILAGAFRAEGDINKATIPMALTAIINIILDPIFIYQLNMGISGAALATGIASLIGLLMMLYWIFIERKTYLDYSLEKFKNKLSIYKDILVVGIPASLEQLIMALLAIIINFMLTLTSGPISVAVYTAGWRIISIGILPAIGIGTAAISVSGVAFGSKNFENLKTTIRYSTKVGFISSLIVAILIFIFSENIAYIFAYSTTSSNLLPLISDFLKLMCLFVLFVPFGATAGNVFQGLGKGTTSLILTSLRELILVLIFSYLIGFILNQGELGIYIGILLGGLIGSIIAYVYIEYYVKRLIQGNINVKGI